MGTAEPGDAGQDAGQGAGQEEERSAGDARDYARRLRSLPADQALGQFLFSLLDTAHVKLGRRDARLLIDVAAVAHEHARAYLPGELTRQIEQVLGQLRIGQVNAENHTGQGGKPERERPGQGSCPAVGWRRPITPPGRRYVTTKRSNIAP